MPSKGTRKKQHLGTRHMNHRGCWYTVVEKTDQVRHRCRLYRIVFDSGYETMVTAIDLYRNKIRDFGTPSIILGKASPGDRIKSYSRHPLYDTWIGILHRTIGPKPIKYYEDVTICSRWLRFDNFADDAVKLPGYDADRLDELTIDKDKLGSRLGKRIYSPETCCWLTIAEQAIYRHRTAPTKAPQCPYRGVHATEGLWIARPTVAGKLYYVGSARTAIHSALAILHRFPDYYTDEERKLILADARKLGIRVRIPYKRKAA